MTPAQLARHFDGVIDRVKGERRQALAIAWQTAAFGRTKRMPRLETLLNRLDPPKRDTRPQSMAEMSAIARAWTKHLGGTIRKGPA